ncbi:MAG: methionine--tRNA ligase [Chloroflexi bacterium]|nr:MAG: methionine--tRNA ligase [Chloroflexota bacterium]
MARNILVAVAWPYASANIHVGNLGGAYLPADIYARYHRLAGDRVLMVSGSDSHGTPITVAADREGVHPRDLFERYHRRFLDLFVAMGLSYDLFTHTDTENHHRVAQDIFLRLHENGFLLRKREKQLYSTAEGRFLPDRYVEGTCPFCGYEHARGDQCEHCGRLMDPLELINPRSRIDGSTPVVRETEHFYLNLPAFSEALKAWLQAGKAHWRPQVLNFARNMVEQGLQPRPITRDLDWGIPVPLPGWEGKCLYVWFEAVIGYLSASIEWAQHQGTPEAWKDWWYDPEARTTYFIGKDNIVFHAVIWPAQLMGTIRLYEEDPDRRLNLPWHVPANEFVTLEGRKISGSRNWAIWVDDYLTRYDPDPLRYYLTANAPETRDTDFSWADFLRRNNDELVATWGNLVHRTLNFAYRNFEGRIPIPGLMDQRDVELLATIDVAFKPIGQLIEVAQFKAALSEVMSLARRVNAYLDEKSPWFQIKEDRQAAGTTIYVALRAIDSLKVLFSPFLPFSSQRLHEMLGYEGTIIGEQQIELYRERERTHLALTYDGSRLAASWKASELPAGQPLAKPKPLFKKLDESIVEEELARLRAGSVG